MVKSKQITFRVHGLDQNKDAVDARVFAAKLSAFVRVLQRSDQNSNGKRCLDFFIADLKMGSATACIVERQASTKSVAKFSGIEGVHAALASIYSGRATELNGSTNLLPAVRRICSGASKAFSHIEIFLDHDEKSTVRVDSFFEKQVRTASAVMESEEQKSKRRLFRGVSLGTFDGTLKLVDHRGAVKLAKLILTAGGAEIECAYNEQSAPTITPAFDRRALIEGWAHYDGTSALPHRVEVRKATPFKLHPNLARWKGAFQIVTDDSGDDW